MMIGPGKSLQEFGPSFKLIGSDGDSPIAEAVRAAGFSIQGSTARNFNAQSAGLPMGRDAPDASAAFQQAVAIPLTPALQFRPQAFAPT